MSFHTQMRRIFRRQLGRSTWPLLHSICPQESRPVFAPTANKICRRKAFLRGATWLAGGRRAQASAARFGCRFTDAKRADSVRISAEMGRAGACAPDRQPFDHVVCRRGRGRGQSRRDWAQTDAVPSPRSSDTQAAAGGYAARLMEVNLNPFPGGL